MSDSFAIRKLQAEDIPSLVELRARMFAEVGFDDTGDLDTVSKAYFARAIPQGEFIGFGAEPADDHVVGIAGLSAYQMPPKPTRPDGRFGYISSMYVLPSHRRYGLGRRLLAAVVREADSLGLTWLTLHASPMGRPIYESVGFKAMNEMALHVPSVRNLAGALSSD